MATRIPPMLRAAVVSVVMGAVVAAAPGQASFRAFWADAFSVGYKNSSQVNDMVNRALQGGYNAIFVEVVAFHDNVGNGHGAYYNSSIVPKATDISSSFDPLQTVINAAHAADIEVHAWIVPYRVSSVWPPSGNALLAAHPEWLMTPRSALGNGPAQVGGYYTLDPGCPEAQEYLTNIVQELVANYEIDGINLDYIRYVQTDAGYPADASFQNSSLERFKRQTGFVGTPNATGNTAWDNFRRQTISEYVRRLRAEIPSIPNPRQPLRLSADLICFGNAPASFESSDPYRLFSDWRTWMQNGWLDMGVPMNYKRDHITTQAAWYRNWVDAAAVWSYNRHFVAGQGNYLNTKANSVAQLDYALDNGADGICTFSYDATADEDTNGSPEADWSWYPYLGANLFPTAVPTPTMPWRDPATATEGTLWGRVLDDATGQPIEGSTVRVGALPASLTDGNGYYVITLLPADADGTLYTATAEAPGCPTQNRVGINIIAGDITRIDFDMCPTIELVGDMNNDGAVTAADLGLFIFCLDGPDFTYASGNFCLDGDGDEDLDVDVTDFAMMQTAVAP